MEQSEKLQKILSRAGLGSRRVMEQVLREGRISVNGKVATLGDRATSSDVIRVDGRIIKIKAPSDRICRVFVYHKPEGEVCTEHDPEGRPSVFDRLPRIPGARLVGVGRLDLNTTGLLLFTTDGELANRLMHPGREIEREYSVRIFGELTEDMISLMLAGVEIEGVTYRFDSVRFTGGEGMNRWYSMVLHEGRNREIRRTLEHFDLQISRLIRVRFGSLALDRDLPRGGWRELTLDEVNRLRELADLPRITKAADSGDDRDDREDFLRRRHRMNEIRRAVRRHGERRRKGEDGFSPFRGPVRPRLGGKRPGSGIGEGAGELEKPWSRSPAGTPEGAPGDAAAGSGDQGSPWKKPAATWKARDGQGDRGGRFHGGGDRGFHADRGPRDGDERPFRGGKGGDSRPFRGGKGGEGGSFRGGKGGEGGSFHGGKGGEGGSFRGGKGGEGGSFHGGKDGDSRPFHGGKSGEGRPFRSGKGGDGGSFRGGKGGFAGDRGRKGGSGFHGAPGGAPGRRSGRGR